MFVFWRSAKGLVNRYTYSAKFQNASPADRGIACLVLGCEKWDVRARLDEASIFYR